MTNTSGNESHPTAHDTISGQQENSKNKRVQRRLALAERRTNNARKVLTPCSSSGGNILLPSSLPSQPTYGYYPVSLPTKESRTTRNAFAGKENNYVNIINDCVVNLMSSFEEVTNLPQEVIQSTQFPASNLTHPMPLMHHMSIDQPPSLDKDQDKHREARQKRKRILSEKNCNQFTQSTNSNVSHSTLTMDQMNDVRLDNIEQQQRVVRMRRKIDVSHQRGQQATQSHTTVAQPTSFGIPNSQVSSIHMLQAIKRHNQKKQARLKRREKLRRKRNGEPPIVEYLDIGDPTWKCEYCGALMWYEERNVRSKRPTRPQFSLCCRAGKVELPLMLDPPPTLSHLFFNKDTDASKHFRDNIRSYNAAFNFTSMAAKVDREVNTGRGPRVFKISGQNYHSIGDLTPREGQRPKFAQLYIYDTTNEVENRRALFSSSNSETGLNTNIIQMLKDMLDKDNVWAEAFRMARDVFDAYEDQNFNLKLIFDRQSDGRTYNLPTVSEVAALIVGDFGTALNGRDIVVQKKNGRLKFVSELHPAYLPLQYPLLFAYGEDGYRSGDLHRGLALEEYLSKPAYHTVTIREFFAFRLQTRVNEAETLLHGGKLFQQFVVDGYTMVEAHNLSYVRNNQKQLRAGSYKDINVVVDHGITESSSSGTRIYLPSSFVGGRRYMNEHYYDAMTICHTLGYPDLFITFTCNQNWVEIKRFLTEKWLRPEDRPDIVTRVFRMKLQQLIEDLKSGTLFGDVIAVVFTIEFQKKGLPHAHILLFLRPEDKFPDHSHIDKIISAEIPDQKKHPLLYERVKTSMMHGPCGQDNKKSPCMKDGKCSKFFPKSYLETTTVDEEGYPLYRRRNNGRTVKKGRIDLDNRYVVPYNPTLLLKYDSHINVEWCNQSQSIKYLFKYINKGHDRIIAGVQDKNMAVNEVKMYLDCRYLSPCESVWRIYGFEIQHREPAVERLSFHLPGEQSVLYEDDEPLDAVLDRVESKGTMFTAWMEANKKYHAAKNLTYAEFPSMFTYKSKENEWTPRRSERSIGRMYYVKPTCGELFYLRIMLSVVKGPESYADIRTINGVVCETYRDACAKLGFVEDDGEYVRAIKDASFTNTGHGLRLLFSEMLILNSLSMPCRVWKETWEYLSEGILRTERRVLNAPGLELTAEQLQAKTLLEIEKILKSHSRSLADFHGMRCPDSSSVREAGNILIHNEMSYNIEGLKSDLQNLITSLTNEQRHAYTKIMEAVDGNKGGVFFLNGYGGTGKTFVWRTLTTALRARGDIVLTVASSRIAATLLPGGRTAHSRFGIPVDVDQHSTCKIRQGSDLAELMIAAKLLIWDEAPMTHKYCFEAFDRSLRDIMRTSNPNSLNEVFGGKAIVFGGDFRQILPVIPGGGRSEVIFATINSSYIWDSCQVLSVTRNMRLQSSTAGQDIDELREFGKWILQIGDGIAGGPNHGEAEIDIPNDLLIDNYDDPIVAIVESTYPDLIAYYKNKQYLEDRAILCPTLRIVRKINDYMMSLIPGEERIYYSSNRICPTQRQHHALQHLNQSEFLNGLESSGLPNHELKLKEGVPVMLLRNIDQSQGLCNGTRLIVTRLHDTVIEAEVMTGAKTGDKVLLHRMLMVPSQSKWPFKLQRRQFPISVCYAMTINKSQGQSLNNVGLYLPKPPFIHGQLYVAISRVKTRKGLKILVHDKNDEVSRTTTNVVWKEVFQNVH